MNKTLPEIVSDIITCHGAIVAKTDGEELEYIAPEELSEKLHISEYGKIGFSYNSFDKEIIPACYDSDLFKSIGELLYSKGKIAAAVANSFTPNIGKISKNIPFLLNFSNATFRMGSIEDVNIPYALIFFKYEALSDDKKEGLCFILINESNLSTTSLSQDLTYHIMNNLEESQNKTPFIDKTTITKTIHCAYSASTVAVKRELEDFTKSLDRRLNRDIRRVYEYYETLKEETKKLIAKRDKNLRQEKADKLTGKLEVIETERKWKSQDLVSKYSLKIDIKPIFMIRIQTQSTRFWINIKRRSQSRPFAIAYNSLLKKLDTLPCEACFAPQDPYYICDKSLHIICSTCFKKCPNCAKRYCKACFKICPKCKKA